jgi:hypothetical protein
VIRIGHFVPYNSMRPIAQRPSGSVTEWDLLPAVRWLRHAISSGEMRFREIPHSIQRARQRSVSLSEVHACLMFGQADLEPGGKMGASIRIRFTHTRAGVTMSHVFELRDPPQEKSAYVITRIRHD